MSAPQNNKKTETIEYNLIRIDDGASNELYEHTTITENLPLAQGNNNNNNNEETPMEMLITEQSSSVRLPISYGNSTMPFLLTAEQTAEILKQNNLNKLLSGTTTVTQIFNQQTQQSAAESDFNFVEVENNIAMNAEMQLEEEHVEVPVGGKSAKPEKRDFECYQCGKTFVRKHHLTNHLLVHSNARPHFCTQCDATFVHKHALKTHMMLHSQERRFVCELCDKRFTLKHHLSTHMLVHSRARPFVCSECGISFALNRHLVAHAKYHTGQEGYMCNDCGEGFKREELLQQHMRFHGAADKTFVCTECDAAFFRRFELIAHMRVHGKMPYSCVVCDKQFLQKRTLLVHTRMHTDQQPYACIACAEGFATKLAMQRHVRIVHAGVNPNLPGRDIVFAASKTKTEMPTTNSSATVSTATVRSATVPSATVSSSAGTSSASTSLSQSPTSSPTLTALNIQPQFSCIECGSILYSREAWAMHSRLHVADNKDWIEDLQELTKYLPTHMPTTSAVESSTTDNLDNSMPNYRNSALSVKIIKPTGEVISQTTLEQAVTAATATASTATHATPSPLPAQMPMHLTAETTSLPANTKQPERFPCVSCGRLYAAKHGLRQHQKRNPNGACAIASHICNECGKSFFQRNHLVLHQRQHLFLKQKFLKEQQQHQQQEQ